MHLAYHCIQSRPTSGGIPVIHNDKQLNFRWTFSLLLFLQSLPEIEQFVTSLNQQLRTLNKKGLSQCQKLWLNLVLTGIAVTGQLYWAIFERRDCFGRVTQDSLRWMFRHSELAWNKLLECSIKALVNKYDLTEGVLVIDDTERSRSKQTSKIHGVNTYKDKKSTGSIPGRNPLYFLCW